MPFTFPGSGFIPLQSHNLNCMQLQLIKVEHYVLSGLMFSVEPDTIFCLVHHCLLQQL